MFSKSDPAANPAMRKPAVWNTLPLPGVKKIIAVASGKGGVGKSTTAVNLALAFARAGKRVGLLDADIYGPSIPRMMGLIHNPHPAQASPSLPSPCQGEGKGEGYFLQPKIIDNKMIPLENHGIQCMSMAFITGDQAAILRGPMISKTLHQLLRFTRWGTEADPLDVLLVDMPPGTGDTHLSMAQAVPLSGAVIVTTPQMVATMDARKCLIMFRKVNVPILGVIENMSGGIFGSGGGKQLAQEMDAPFLGEIPMDAAIVEASDSGKVYEGVNLNSYMEIAKTL